jgi:hypothetical protein
MPARSREADTPHSLSVRAQARIAGALYLIVIAGGLFAEGVVLGPLTVAGDAAATARAIANNETIWRWGLGVHFIYLGGAALVMYVLLYRLFRRAQPTFALLALVFAVVSAAVEGAALLQLYVPLAIMENARGVAALGPGNTEAVIYLAVRLYEAGFGFALLFFSGFCAATGVIILRSRLAPRPVGVMMVLAGACYLVGALSTTVAPGIATLLFPWILLPCLVGEASLALWLVVKGADAGQLARY